MLEQTPSQLYFYYFIPHFVKYYFYILINLIYYYHRLHYHSEFYL
jgi:hypothetical protein